MNATRDKVGVFAAGMLAWFPPPRDLQIEDRIAATAAAFRVAEILTLVARALTKRDNRRAKG